ncbi:MAG: YadA-like family protein [Megamonas funiformis]|uniref:YadA-like family protein n=1 Tax=Megamonas funiformis TaxID=437897 RepID=UPI002A7FB950|nr:YadA-like family protein [Megamonas funiformis]MDY3874289.1 YadA-like family protein [Megamonas funiformis]
MSTSTINSTGTNDSKSAKSEVNYSTGVKDTVTNGINTTESKVAYNGVTDTVKDDENNTIASSSVSTGGITNTTYGKSISDYLYSDNNRKNLLASSVINKSGENGSITLTANKYDEVGAKTSSSLTIKGDSASLTSGSASVKVDNATGNVTLSGKNVNLGNNTFSLKNTTTGKDIAKIDSSGLTVNGTGTSSIKSTNTNESSSTVGSYTKNDISSTGMTTTAKGGKWPSDSDYDNKTTSSVTYTGVRDTVYDDSGNIKSTSVVDTNGVTLTSNRYDTGSKISSSLTIKGDSATLASGSAYVKVDNTVGNVTLSGKNVKLDSNGLNIYDGTSTTPTATISKTGAITGKAITGTGLKIDGKNTGTGLTVDGAATSSIISRNPGNWDEYTKSQVAYNGVTDTVYDSDGRTVLASSSISKSGKTGKITLTTNKYDDNTNLGEKIASSSLTLDGENVLFSGKNASLTSTGLTVNGTSSTNPDAKSTSTVAYNGVTDTVTNGTYTTTSTVSATGVTNTVKNGADIVADSKVSATYGITNTTYGKNIGDYLYSDTDRSKVLASSVISKSEDTGKIALTTNKYDENGNKTSSTLSLNGDSASLKVGSYGFAVDSNNNVSIAGNNATLSGSTFTLKDANGKTATLNTSGLTLKDEDGNTTGGISTTGAVTGTSLSIKAPIDPIKPNNDYVESKVTTSGVADTIKQGGFTRATSNVTINSIKDTIYTNDGKELSSSNISKSVSDATESGSVTLIANKITTNDDATTTTLTSKLNLTGDSATLTSGSAYVKADNTTGNVLFSGKNVSLSGSTFTLKDTTNGKTLASLGASGLSLNKVNSDGTTANYGTWNSSGLTVTATNTTGNKTTSQVSATGVTDRVYGTDGTTQVASSSISTSGISNTTSLKTTTGKIDTAINQNTSGVGISSIKYDTNNNVTDKTSVSVNGGTSSITSYGNYVYGEDGKATSYNQASMSLNGNTGIATIRGGSNTASSTLTLNEAGVGLSGKNVSLTSTDLTLKNVETGKAYVKIGSNGLNIYNDEGTSVFGVTRTGAINIDKNVTIDDSYTKDGYTYTASNSISGSNGISNVATKKDESGKTIATNRSTVTTSGITNSTNISGIAIKDDKNNTKTMNTSIAQNANGVNISSTKYNVYNDGTSKVQTTDGTSTISVNGAKTTISGSGNYEYKKDENGKLVVSSRNSASLSVDGESGIISLSGKNVGLDANGLTLYKDVEGVKTQYASLNAGGLNVNGTGTTTIKSTNATTGAMGQSQLSYNGVTDTVTNAAGNKTTSTVNATGTIDQVYDVDGKTRIAYSNVTTSGITDSFTKDGVTNSVTTNTNGTTFASTGNGTTTIKGGSITTNSITVAGNTIDGGFFDTIGETNGNTAGIVRTEINGDWITSIEGALDISRSGNISLNADKLTYSYNDGKNSGTLGALANKVDDIYNRTQGIDYDKATGTTTIDGNLSVKDETTTGGTAGSTGETGTTPINGNITANTANIGGVQMGNNTVTATTGNFENITVGGTEGTSINKDGVTVGDKKSDNYTSITNNDVVVNNNGNKTSLADVGNRVTGLESSVNSMNNRLSDVEDRIDKVGAMSAAIANLRTMGFDPEAPTEIAIGVGQYKSETGLALGVFHYPNQDFMLSASISTSGDEVMGGIGATWKLGRKSAAEKAKDEEARRLEKAEEMKKLAQDAKVKAQAERHAKLLAEREAQKTA